MNKEELAQALAAKITDHLIERGNKKEEAFLKAKPQKNKQGVVTNGAIIERMLSIIKKITADPDAVATIEKTKKISGQAALEVQKNKYHRLMDLADKEAFSAELLELQQEYQAFVVNNTGAHKPCTWLNHWVYKASDISFATHVGKLTHSSSRSSSILDTTSDKNDCYLTTNQLKNLHLDTASTNAASLPIADILKLSVEGVSVLDFINEGDSTVFKTLVANEPGDQRAMIDTWYSQLSQSVGSTQKQKQSYFLAKQVYFPVGSQQYHLLMPLTSSSLVQALHQQVAQYRDAEQINARLQQRKGKYSPTSIRTYPNKANWQVTASNHSNASELNGKRAGRVTLLSAMPSQWKFQATSYIKKSKSTLFDKTLYYVLQEEISDLREYLLLMQSKALSINDPERNQVVMSKLQAISNQLFNYLDTINDQESCEGWTLNSKLPDYEQLAFEPRRTDAIAISLKMDKAWQKKFSGQYGIWLNKQLSYKNKLKLTTIHTALWSDYFLLELRDRVATQEVEL